jgi:hypothetical protein
MDPISFITVEQAKTYISNTRLKHKNGTELSNSLKKLHIRDRLFMQYQCEYAESSLSSNEVQR